MCCGFDCTRTTLSLLNIMYIVMSFIMISAASYSKSSSIIVTNISVFWGIISCGFFLFILSIFGFVATRKHHQVMLFFYMTLLFILSTVQFSISAACLSSTEEDEMRMASNGWSLATNETRKLAEKSFYCCGFADPRSQCQFDCCMKSAECRCKSCSSLIRSSIDSSLNTCGIVALVFSFIQFFGVWLTIRFRNQKDPTKDPTVAFL